MVSLGHNMLPFEWFVWSYYALCFNRQKHIRPCMIASSYRNIFRVTGLLWGESTGHRWIHLTKASVVEIWCFRWSASEQTVQQTIETPVIWNVIAFICRHSNGDNGCVMWFPSLIYVLPWILYLWLPVNYIPWKEPNFGHRCTKQ